MSTSPAFFASGPGQAERLTAWFEGALIPFEDARISVMTHAFLYGTAVHESLRCYYDDAADQLYIFRLRDHMERLRANARILKINLEQSADELTETLTTLVRANNFHRDSYIRCVAYKSGLQFGLTLNGPHDLLAFCTAAGRFHAEDRAVSLCVTSWRRIQDNAIPARGKINGVYVNSSLAMTEAIDNGFDDAVFLTESGHVSEGSGMNIFLVRGNTVITPAVSENILEGLTRATILQLLDAEPGLKVEQRPVARTELYAADEIFLTGTAMEVVRVGSVDHRPIGTGAYPIAERLRAAYFEVVRGKRKEFSSWLTPVYPPRP